jgi:hypothetical protein
VTAFPTSLVSALSLVVGYAVAAGTGVRALGGVVLLVALAWCAVRWKAMAGTTIAAALVASYVVLFVVSHLLALAIGPWPSVVVVAAVMGALAWSLARPENLLARRERSVVG